MPEQREARFWSFDGDFGISLLIATDPAGVPPGDVEEARAVKDDARLLLESPLPDEVLRTVWRAASAGHRDPGADPRSALRWMIGRCEEVISVGEPDPMPGTPAVVVVDEGAMKAKVLAEVPAVSGLLIGPQLASALARVVAEVDADLGFRLLLRVLKAYGVQVDLEHHDRYREIGEEFGYPEPLVPQGLAVRWPRFDDASARRRFVRDFGFSFLAGRFHGDLWQHSYTVEEGIRGVAADEVGAVPGASAFALLQDTLRLQRSLLPDDILLALWQVATGRGHDFDGQTIGQWLHHITDICTDRLRELDPDFTVTTPAPADMSRRDAVLRELRDTAPALTDAVHGSPWFGADTSPWFALSESAAPVLEQIVTQVDPDLGFRLLLRTVRAYSVPVTDEHLVRYAALGREFGYGRRHIADLVDSLREG
ncbi:PI-PLC domain-containing protein [Streptomyces pseudovenezuelae]|uniref:hypothetical protein n=1 Tax=Streptomyces pseudovenezuelae TaxID=67350 RepID=UPI003712F0C3